MIRISFCHKYDDTIKFSFNPITLKMFYSFFTFTSRIIISPRTGNRPDFKMMS